MRSHLHHHMMGKGKGKGKGKGGVDSLSLLNNLIENITQEAPLKMGGVPSCSVFTISSWWIMIYAYPLKRAAPLAPILTTLLMLSFLQKGTSHPQISAVLVSPNQAFKPMPTVLLLSYSIIKVVFNFFFSRQKINPNNHLGVILKKDWKFKIIFKY